MPPHILYGLVTLIVMCIWFMLNFFAIKNVETDDYPSPTPTFIIEPLYNVSVTAHIELDF